MARTTVNIPTNLAQANVEAVLQNFFAQNGYEQTNYKKTGEVVYRKIDIPGLTATTFVKIVSIAPNNVTVETWIGATFGKEVSLDDGFYAVVPKQALRVEIDSLAQALSGAAQAQVSAQAQAQMPIQAQAQALAQPINQFNQGVTVMQNNNINPILAQKNDKWAIISLVVGIIGCVLPLIGVTLGWLFIVFGIIFGVYGRKSTKPGMALAGIILNCVAIVISIIMVVVAVAAQLR
ncbi:MAG: DUF4190 domain-containing protein [Candidatus Nomurabacteria bacterium]|jgi:hypothetical protein|nr:DUF4190 domain-containing protein [Candidatus Nomurabacteria bacterium]